ncbi:MAG TPA: sigma 54-interacting transcriptional regulator, partial [Longimicrobiales bacterium]
MSGKTKERWRGALPDAAALSALGELARVGVFEVDGDRNVVSVNAEVERITGFSADEVVGKACVALMRCPECLKSCTLQQEGRIPAGARLRIFRKDGAEVLVERAGLVRRDVYGGFAGGLETIREVDGRACTAAPPELDSLLGSLGRSYVVLDGSWRILGLSERLAGLLGTSTDALRGQPAERVFGSELFGEGAALREAVLSGRRREGWRAVLALPAGGELAVSLSVGPVDAADHCGRLGARAMIMVRPEEDAEGAEEEIPSFAGMVARSAAMQKIFRLIELLRDTDSTVLITGESGTGKELVARALHAASHRARGPFVAVNCAAIPSELLESELFGHMRGAFTGAVRDKPGRFELADGGTLFLDEIGDLAPALQAKLLRVLQEHAFERVGDTRTRTADVRVLAATHVNLGRAVAEHRFREDLYYRLRVVPIEIPPCRDRREDLPVLIRFLLGRIGLRRGRSLRLSPAASRALLTYDWPGNVRELENALEYATTVCEGQTVHLTDLPAEIAQAPDANGGAGAGAGSGPNAAAARGDRFG